MISCFFSDRFLNAIPSYDIYALLRQVRFLRPGVFDLNRFRFVVEFAPPPAAAGTAGGGKGKPAAASSSSAPLPPPQQQQQQRRDSSASQQGRVTFVFPAQYLVTVATPPPPVLPLPSGVAGKGEGLSGKGMTGLVSPVSAAMEEVLVA